MLTIISAVASRYATALYELAFEKGQLAAVSGDVAVVKSQVEQGALVALFDPRSKPAEQHSALAALIAKLGPLTGNFVRLLADKRRLEVLRELPAAFHRNQLAATRTVEGVAQSARPLGAPELSQLSASLGRMLNKQVVLQNQIQPDLVGGVRVLVDNRLLDQSATGRLEALRSLLMNARLD